MSETDFLDPRSVASATIEAALERVLETMCFSAVMGPLHPDLVQPNLRGAARVQFRGPTTGWVGVACDDRAATCLARNFLGMEDVPAEQTTQFLGELANMICGAVVSDFAAHGQYDLSSPESMDPSVLTEVDGKRVDVELEEGFLSVIAHQD
ncbi:MAG: hypothetical protein RL328_1204 [Acidobacteriota bacterium]|jgi:CheY-specific phosphatase CheX